MSAAVDLQLFFIVGRGRSGTTLLARMLTQHPQLVVAPEGFFALSLRRRYLHARWDDACIDAFCRDVVRENRMRTWRLDLDALAGRLRAHREGLDYAGACRLVYYAYAADVVGRPQVRGIGDKNPHYALFVPALIELFPGARFVHIVRDPRDNVCSYRNVPFDLGNVAALAYRWRRYNEEIMAMRRSHPDRFLQVRYEDLVAEGERELERVSDFVGVRFDAAMLRFHEASDDGFYGRKSRWFSELRKPLDDGRVARWREQLGPRELQAIAAICGAQAHELGYDLGTDARLGLRMRAGALVGRSSVAAERWVFGVVPHELRSALINTYRRASGRT